MIYFNKEQFFIVTGASSGIGEGVALLLNELGASVVGIGRNQERLEAMKAKAKNPENIHLEQKDLTEDIEGLPAYVKSLKDKYGKFQGLVCSAGITETNPLQLLDLTEMKGLFDIDYFVPVMMAKGFADRRVNNGRGASIVCLSSLAAYASMRGMVTYSGAKAALSASMKSISRELAPSGVRVNCVSPADVLTPMTLSIPEITNSKKDSYPLGFGEICDVANLIVYLLSDNAKWITGQDYRLDGGSF